MTFSPPALVIVVVLVMLPNVCVGDFEARNAAAARASASAPLRSWLTVPQLTVRSEPMVAVEGSGL